MPAPLSLSLWYEALGSPHGIIIEVSDIERAKQRLYALRKEANDEDLASLSICTSPSGHPNQLWLVKKNAQA